MHARSQLGGGGSSRAVRARHDTQPCIQCKLTQAPKCTAGFASVLTPSIYARDCRHGPFCPKCHRRVAQQVLPTCMCRALIMDWSTSPWQASYGPHLPSKGDSKHDEPNNDLQTAPGAPVKQAEASGAPTEQLDKSAGGAGNRFFSFDSFPVATKASKLGAAKGAPVQPPQVAKSPKPAVATGGSGHAQRSAQSLQPAVSTGGSAHAQRPAQSPQPAVSTGESAHARRSAQSPKPAVATGGSVQSPCQIRKPVAANGAATQAPSLAHGPAPSPANETAAQAQRFAEPSKQSAAHGASAQAPAVVQSPHASAMVPGAATGASTGAATGAAGKLPSKPGPAPRSAARMGFMTPEMQASVFGKARQSAAGDPAKPVHGSPMQPFGSPRSAGAVSQGVRAGQGSTADGSAAKRQRVQPPNNFGRRVSAVGLDGNDDSDSQ